MSFGEVESVMAKIQKRASKNIGEYNAANIIWGAGDDDQLNDEVTLTLVATGFENVDGGDNNPPDGGQDGGAGGGISTGTGGGGISTGRPTGTATGTQQPQATTIKLMGKDRSAEVKEFISKPSYVRRNVKLYAAMPSGKGQSITIESDEPETPQQQPKEQDLFG